MHVATEARESQWTKHTDMFMKIWKTSWVFGSTVQVYGSRHLVHLLELSKYSLVPLFLIVRRKSETYLTLSLSFT